VLQPIAAVVYCNRRASAGRRRQAKVGNFHAPAGACATELRPWVEFAKNYFMVEGTTREIK